MRIANVCTLLALTTALAMPNGLAAQEPFAIKRTVLPSLDSQVRARLVALDRRLNPVHTPHLAVALVGQIASPDQLLGGFAPLLSDARNNDVWEQLADEYYRMTLESGDALLAHSEEGPATGVAWSSGQVRRLCHLRLTQLPRATLTVYRQRVDAEAKALFAQGKMMRSSVPLRRLVDDLFCSSVTDQALDLLGDLAFERGDFDEARHWWDLLAPKAKGELSLRFPNPTVDLARVQAKLVLCQLFQGQFNEAREAIQRFQHSHPDAKGDLAGRTERYATILNDTLEQLAAKRITNNDEPWTTFGGDVTRNRVMSQAPSWSLLEDGPAWRVKLPGLIRAGKPSIIDRGTLTRSMAFHPIIIGQQVLIADHRSVISYHLFTGKELFRYDLKTAGLSDPGPGVDADIARPRFTLSADDQRAYVRLGRYAVGPAEDGKSTANYLVCLDITEPDVAKKRELWHIKAESDEKNTATFEGAPLVHGGYVYAVLSKVVNQRTLSSIVCYDTRGKERWAREVCESPEFERHSDGARQRQHLLTWADGQIVYCSHAGAIVAVDAWTGQPTWGVRYPSRGPRTAELEPSPRDLAPALSVDGCIIAAPLDSERVFCVDARSGHVRWELENVEITHLLGAAHGRIFVSTRTGIAALDASTGQVEWTQPSAGRLPSLGRGLLAGGWLFWPTEDTDLPYRAVTLREGKVRVDAGSSVLPEPAFFEPSMMHTLPAGNLAFGHGCLVIAGTSELVVYVPIHKQPVLDQPPQARIDALYQQARRQVSTGQTKEAAQTYRQLLDVAKASPHAKAWHTLIAGRLQLLDSKLEPILEPERPILTAAATSVATKSTLPLIHAWEHDGGRVWACDDARGDFLCTQAGDVSCRALADGAVRWRRPLAFVPAWVERWADHVAIVGADAVQTLHAKDGRSAWSFTAPSRRLRFGSVIDGVPKIVDVAKGFVHGERWDDTLLVLDDHRHFCRLHRATGEIVWQYALPSAELRPIAGGAFTPFMTCLDSQLLAQTVTGQALWLGKAPVLMGDPGRQWAQAPFIIDGRVILTSNPGRIDGHALKPPHAKLERYQAPWPNSLSGELGRLIHQDSVLLAVIGRNDGPDLIRLNPEKRQLLWTIPSRELADRLDVESISIGDTSFFYVQAGQLYARSLNDGSVQWSLSLSPSTQRWQIRYTKEALAVYPTSARGDFTVDFIDPWQGQRLQRLTFADVHGPTDLIWTPRVLIVATGAKIYGFRSLDRE